MALFSRDAENPQEPTVPTPATPQPAPPKPAARPKANQQNTVLATGAKLRGDITGNTDVVIEGQLSGKIRPNGDVTVLSGGSVKGEIDAHKVRVAGKVTGNVKARDSVEILPSGSLEGDVAAPSMAIGEGAFFKGSVEMTGQPGSEVSKRSGTG